MFGRHLRNERTASGQIKDFLQDIQALLTCPPLLHSVHRRDCDFILLASVFFMTCGCHSCLHTHPPTLRDTNRSLHSADFSSLRRSAANAKWCWIGTLYGSRMVNPNFRHAPRFLYLPYPTDHVAMAVRQHRRIQFCMGPGSESQAGEMASTIRTMTFHTGFFEEIRHERQLQHER
jgi:hypothetical protein